MTTQASNQLNLDSELKDMYLNLRKQLLKM